MFTATIITMSLAFFIGLYLVWHAGIVVLFIGVLSLIFGIAYTGGPYPLGYNGLVTKDRAGSIERVCR